MECEVTSRSGFDLWTDGGCDPNPGVGGWAFVLIDLATGCRTESVGSYPATTNNRMEMLAIIKGLEAIPRDVEATVYSDSKLCVSTINDWMHRWERNGWSRSAKKYEPPANLDLVQRLFSLCSERRIVAKHVPAHAGVELNERCDALCAEAIRAQKKEVRR